jgi:hypothetical protein
VCTIKADAKETCQESGGNTSKPQGYMDQRFSREATARWSRIGNSGIVGESELPAQSCSRGGRQRTLRMMTRPWELSSAGTNAGHGGGLFFIWRSAALRMRGSSRKFDHLARVRYSLPGVDPTQGNVGTRACATTANRAPSIHMQLGCSSHTLKRCLAKRTQHICERRSTLLNGTGGKLPSLAPPTQLP